MNTAKFKNLALPILVACSLLFGAVHGNAAQITVKVDSTRPWIGWLNVFETNDAYVRGEPWYIADLPAMFIPTNSPSGWPLNAHLVLRPNTSTYNTGDPFWNFPDGRPNKVLEPHFYVDVYMEFAGKTVTFKGSVTSNTIPGLTGGPATGWQTIAFIKEFTPSYGYLGATTVALNANSPFSLSRAIGPGNVCQYGFFVRGPNTAPGSANAMTGVGIRVEDPDPMIFGGPYGNTINRGTTTSLDVTAIGSSTLSYLWKHDGVVVTNGGNISGANTASLTISNAQLSDTGEYIATVSNTAGSVDSQAAQLTVLCVLPNEGEAFVIQSIAGDSNGSFMLAWESCSEHLYEVQTSGEPSAPTSWTPRALMIGEDGATSWMNTNAPATDHQFYRVQRFSFGGDEDGDGLSNLGEFNRGADLRNPDTDGDEMRDGWEAQYGLNPLDPNDLHADLDGDGYSNGQEYLLRTKPNASYSQPADPPRGLVAWWKLDEGTGTNVFDSSQNGHDGFVMGSDPSGVWTAGAFSNAAALGGPANNWIEVPYHASLAATQELTLMGWVKPSGGGVLIANWPSAAAVSGNYLLAFGPDVIAFNFSPAGNGGYQNQILFNPNWSTNDWHHLAVTYANGTNVAVFVDGELRASRVTTETFLPVENPIRIGFPGSTDASSVDDVRIYNRALTTNEIASFSRGNGLPVSMIVGQAATLRAFGAAEGDICQWSVVSGQGFFTNTANLTTDFRPSWSGAVTVQVVYATSGVLHTNRSQTTVTFPSLSPLSGWNDYGVVQYNNNCYNFSTDIRTDTMAQPGGPPYYYAYTCPLQTSAVIADGLQAGVDLADLCHTSGLPEGHLIALLVWPNWDFHFVRLEADGTWSSKAGGYQATTLDNAGQPILDPRTANFGYYQFCGFFWVGPDVHIRR